MVLEERKLLVGELTEGMFVSRLDRDWVGTPFPFQGFFITSQDEIRLLAEYCCHVFVDFKREQEERAKLLSQGQKLPPVARERRGYQNLVDLDAELANAGQAKDQARRLAEDILADVRAGRRLNPAQVADAVEPLVASVLRNVDALAWLLSLVRKDDYGYSHAINCSVLAASLGRHLALPQPMLVDLATGGFLLDVGMSALPPEVAAHAGPLDEAQRKAMQGHVAHGLRLLEEAGLDSRWVVEMVGMHHERHDGSGYPNGMSGNQIPVPARIAGLVDTYDAIISDRLHRKARSRHFALQEIYRARGVGFQGEVVEQFLQCLSVYPTGSLVQLNTGEVGVVMAQNLARRLRPRVMILLDAHKRPYDGFRDVDLMALAPPPGQRPVEIAAALEPGAYGLDPAEYFLG